MAKTRQVETEYVRLDGGKFTVAPTRGQFYGATCKLPTVSEREWNGMVQDAITVERKIRKALSDRTTTDITLK